MKEMLLLLTILGCLLAVGKMDAEDDQAAQANYCEMVELFDKTGGEQGWPAYDGREQCK